jgi:transcriptional regulator with XRE-family HTH domain
MNLETLENTPDSMMKSIAESMRQIRKQKGLTLKSVEKLSHGRWKAVVVGSYERQDRALSLNKAIALAAFYQVPLDQLLGLSISVSDTATIADSIVIDLRRALNTSPSEDAERLFQKFLTSLCSKRRDWNGEVLSLRSVDLQTIALILDQSEDGARSWLKEKRYIFMQEK